MAYEITEEGDEDSYFITNKEAQKDKIRKLLKHQKNQYNTSSSSSSSSSTSCSTSSYSLSSTGAALRSSFDHNRSQKLLNLMKKGSTSLRRLFDMEHTSLGNHFDFYSASPETKTIPLWGSDSDDVIHDDPWLGIRKFDRGFAQEHEEHEEEYEEEREEKKKQEHQEEPKDSLFRKNKLTRKKSFSKLPSFYKFRFRFRFRLRLRLRLRTRFCFKQFGEKKEKK